MRRSIYTAWLCAATAVGLPAAAAPPVVPTSLPYQALLLDGTGQPRSGSVEIAVRIYDAVFGGTLVYKQTFPAVPLASGVFTVQLGPTGDATDAPSNPLTNSLATALAGDAGPTAPVRYLEATVGAEGPLSRTQILSSAYALRASSASVADSAATAADAASVGGFSSEWVADFFTYADLDGGNPPNTDPLEGVLDSDNDGRANFLDSDNDNDGFLDSIEVLDGTHVNLITPSLASVVPNHGFFGSSTTVNLNGTNFGSGMTVGFGAESPTPTVLSAIGAQVGVGPQVPGVVNVTVTLPNGQAATRTNAFTFDHSTSHPVAVVAPNVPIAARTGTFEVVLGGAQQYGVGYLAQSLFPLASKGGAFARIGVAFDPTGHVAGLRCRDLGSSCVVEVLVDGDGDDALEDETGIPIETVPSSAAALLVAALEHDAAGRWAAGYVRYASTVDAAVAHDRNGDGDFADANELVTIETALASFGFPTAAGLAIDGSNRIAYAYIRNLSVDIRLAWDRSGDGDFSDTVGGNPELATLDGGLPTCIGAAFDASDRLAVIYATAAGTKLARDGNADGDFADPGEIQVLNASTANSCDVANRSGHAFAAAYSLSGIHTALLVDGNEDGDFADAGETSTITAGSNPLGLALDGAGHAIVGTTGFLRFGLAN